MDNQGKIIGVNAYTVLRKEIELHQERHFRRG